MAFYFIDGWLYCENLRVKDIQLKVENSPFYLYSFDQIRKNYQDYVSSFNKTNAQISYAVKANGNLAILRKLQDFGSWATLVSGNELKLALTAGFIPTKMIYNGNGKTLSELVFAAEQGVYINIDSTFDLHHVNHISQVTGKEIRVLLRVNPGIDSKVHPHVSTGQSQSKFGVQLDQLPLIFEKLKNMSSLILVGIHCHLGSNIWDVSIFEHAMGLISNYFEIARSEGFPVELLNIGGGLGIDYLGNGEEYPTPADLAAAVNTYVPENALLIIEPGRSIIGNAGILVCKVIGLKFGLKNFIVIDGSMTEFLRPSLYQAYHKIETIEPIDGKVRNYDVVGPVCESGDFIGLDRKLKTPKEGTGIAVFDSGAYGYAMCSNYNGRGKPAEFLVDGNSLTEIRRAENFEDQMRLYEII
jgi:diaminopimelate decarboxylase